MKRTMIWLTAGLLLSLASRAFCAQTSIDEEEFPDDPPPSAAASKPRALNKAGKKASPAAKRPGKRPAAAAKEGGAKLTAQVIETDPSSASLTIKDKDGMTGLLHTSADTRFTRGPEDLRISFSDVRPGDTIRYVMDGPSAMDVHVNVYVKKKGSPGAAKKPAPKKRRPARPRKVEEEDTPRVVIDTSDREEAAPGDSERGDGESAPGGQPAGGARPMGGQEPEQEQGER